MNGAVPTLNLLPPASPVGSAAALEITLAARQGAARLARRSLPERRLLLAAGDSWFAYWPRGDLLDQIEDRAHVRIERSARAGATLAELVLAQPATLLEPVPRRAGTGAALQWLLQRLAGLDDTEATALQAILVSAGGNDVAGKPHVLRALVAPRAAHGVPALTAAADEIIGVRLRELYAQLLQAVTQACLQRLGRTVPIVVHGYAHPVPDGRGVLGRNWLRPTLEGELGYVDLAERVEVMRLLIDRLNDTLADLAGPGKAFPHLRWVDLRGLLSNGRAPVPDAWPPRPAYQLDWQNELHPTLDSGFPRLAERLRAAVESPVWPAAEPARVPAGAPDAEVSGRP